MKIFIENSNQIILTKIQQQIEILESELDSRQIRTARGLINKGLPKGLARKLAKYKTQDWIRDFLRFPYEHVDDLVRFSHVDTIGSATLAAPERVEAAVLDCIIMQSRAKGHLFVTSIMSRARGLIGCSFDSKKALDSLELKGKVRVLKSKSGRDFLYTKENYVAEDAVAWKLGKVLSLPSVFSDIDVRVPDGLSRDQSQAVIGVFKNRVSLLSGLPGTGKTTTCGTIVSECIKNGKTVTLVAPTGIAAKRLQSSCGAPAWTCHRAIFTHASKGDDKPFDADLVVVDECSMMDQETAGRIVSLVGNESHIVFIGDAEQLPSVGEGEVFHQMIKSKAIPHYHLSEIFRSAKDSIVTKNAHRIQKGQMPIFTEDYQIFDLSMDRIISLYDHPDVKVLSPGWKGEWGVTSLNEKIRECYNNPAKKWRNPMTGTFFGRNDRVMVCKNNYDYGVVNGDTGVLSDFRNDSFEVSLDSGSTVVLDADFMIQNVILAYASTIHKSQGQEYRRVVLVYPPEQNWSLYRSLVYTALTRAKEEVFIVGNIRDIRRAINKNTKGQRNSLLWRKLQVARKYHDSN